MNKNLLKRMLVQTGVFVALIPIPLVFVFKKGILDSLILTLVAALIFDALMYPLMYFWPSKKSKRDNEKS